MKVDRDTLEHHEAWVPSDNAFQRKARLLQALWRERADLPVGHHRGRPLGSRLAMPFAETSLANYMTAGIREVVQAEVLDPRRSAGKLYKRPRIFDDLLSSQPMCFNLFGELQRDLDLAARALRLFERDIHQVHAVRFEHSPGRGDPAYTGDRSAFDVFIEYEDAERRRGFLGIEVKYHESLRDSPSTHKPRYDAVADAMGCFDPSARDRLRARPLQQIWRDHLLAGSLLQAGDFDRGRFVLLYPSENERCVAAGADYARTLANGATFATWTLESLVTTLGSVTDAGWVRAFSDRYLGGAG